MKPRNVVEFSYDVRAEAIRFFNNVEKYINLITTDLQKKGYLILIVEPLSMIFVVKSNL